MAAYSDRASTLSCKWKTTTGDEHLDVLIGLFPQVNLLTLIDVCSEFKNDVDAAVEYIFCNVLPTVPDDHDANADRDLHIEGPAFVDNSVHPDSVQFDVPNKYTAENKDSVMGENVMQSPHAASSGQDILLEDNNSDCSVASAQNSLVRCSIDVLGGYDDEPLQSSSSEEKHDASAFDDEQPLHDDGLTDDDEILIGGYDDEQLQFSSSKEKHDVSASAFDDDQSSLDGGLTDMTMQGLYSPFMDELTILIANENDEMNSLMIEMANINQKLQEVELKEAKAKQLVSEASQAGNDILGKVEELRDMTMLAVEENNKVAGEVLYAQSILASEALGLRSQFLNLNEEREQCLTIVDRMSDTLERRLAAVELESAKAEKEKIERETLAEQALKKQEFLFDAVKERSKKLEQDARDIEKMREVLIDRGQVVDALRRGMPTIFHSIRHLQSRVDMQPLEPTQVPSSMFNSVKSTDNSGQLLRSGVDESQLCDDDASPGRSSSANSIHNIAQAELIVDEPQLPVYEPLQLAPLNLSSSVMKSEDNIARLLGREYGVHFPVAEPRLSVDSSPRLSSPANSIHNNPGFAHGVAHLPIYEPSQLSSSTFAKKYQTPLSIFLTGIMTHIFLNYLRHNIFTGDDGDEETDTSSDNTYMLDEICHEETDDASSDNTSTLDAICYEESDNTSTLDEICYEETDDASSHNTFVLDEICHEETDDASSDNTSTLDAICYEESDDASTGNTSSLDDSWDIVDDATILMCATAN
ncbi:hypothetical protein GUJ93_ZPchr0010g10159 [Zizania palustris]|uniref:CUE domain-containing protein n=1 Tax=Zizania palustris TaxID=103762 RepID=A0A8J5W9G0_ZIZPA|nr:hypothetical protein GUJ93_ZPchr0010g10159 [Zizania palustris]